jgi:[ribosomal protein S5]-alanine N-acetyltransferase
MQRVTLASATRADADELIQGNVYSREHHLPWTTPFADVVGFDAWFSRFLTRALISATTSWRKP